MKNVPISVAFGDGIGPEIMKATLSILEAAGAGIDPEVVNIGKDVYLKGITTGIEEDAWKSLYRTKIFLKAPITTPFGGGYKSLNVTTRKTLGLFANIRPCYTYTPHIPSKHPLMDVIIVRENEEDLYAGIEYRHTRNSFEALKLITRPGSERIIRYAFEHARRNNRKKVTCFVKDNIMKFTDGIFHTVFDEVAKEFPEIHADSIIIDIGAARLADTPKDFDVIVTSNLYGDILSDIGVQISGSVGIGGSANIGTDYAMFEAIHGSAPDIAGKGIANPSGLLFGSLMMLNHIGQGDVAAKIHNSWMTTIEDGIHTGDIASEDHTTKRVGTKEFAQALIERLGQEPKEFKPAVPSPHQSPLKIKNTLYWPKEKKELVGCDVFVDYRGTPDVLAEKLQLCEYHGMKLSVISLRGVKAWPGRAPQNLESDLWQCRFEKGDLDIDQERILKLIDNIRRENLMFVKIENLYTYDDQRGFSLAQGQ